MVYPSYLNLSKKEWQRRIKKGRKLLEKCRVCPRKCGVNRLKNVKKGFCRLGRKTVVSSFHPHFGEERPLVGEHGSGTIFFAHCNLACVYCQNYDISQLDIGQEVFAQELAEMMISLQNLGCHNINLVTPSPNVPQILESLPLAIRQDLKIPLVYNTSSYDAEGTLKLLDGIVDIYMPDTKYSDDKFAIKFSIAPHYFEIMKKAIQTMHRQVGDFVVKDGIAYRGLLVRHLVLPNNLAGSQKIFAFLTKEISPNTYLNIMAQYRPCFKAERYPELARPITDEEYQEAIKLARKAGLQRFDGADSPNFYQFPGI